MEPNDNWSFKVYLLKKYDYYPNHPLQRGEPVPPFYPWFEKDQPSIIEFKTVHTINELEDVLHRAHVATLNPAREPQYYVHGPVDAVDDESQFQADFSPNAVCVDVSVHHLRTEGGISTNYTY